jgi:putative transposase
VADITQQRTGEGWLYLAVVLDAFSRRVVGWSMADHLRTELVLDALEMAIVQRNPTAGWCITAITTARTPRSPSAVAESFLATLECELLNRDPWPTRTGLRTAIFDFIEVFYNRQRRHSTLDYHPPATYEQHHASAASAA